MPTANELLTKAFDLFDESNKSSKYEDDGNRIFALEMLNEGYMKVCRETQCYRTSGAITTVKNTREYDLPDGFVSLDFVSYGNYKVYPVMRGGVHLGAVGPPVDYYLINNKIGFDPLPDSAYIVEFFYFGGPTADLTLEDTPSLIPAMWQRILPYYVTMKLFATDKRGDQSGFIQWKAIFEEFLEEMSNYFGGDDQYTELPEID
jgi:hypothetical protein